MTPETIHALKRAEAAEKELRRYELSLKRANEQIMSLEVRYGVVINRLTEGAGI